MAGDPWAEFAPKAAPAAQDQDPWSEFKPRAKAEADTLLDVVKQFVGGIPKGIAGTADAAPLLAPGMMVPHLLAKEAKKRLGVPDPTATELWDKSGLAPDKPKTSAGEYAATIGETVGGSLLPGAGWIGVARNLAARPAAGLATNLVQRAAQATAANPTAAAGFDLASAVTGGAAQQFAKDEGAGPVGQTVAAMAGGMVPILPSLAAGPINRFRGAMANQGQTGAYTRFASQLPEGDIDLFANQVATGAGRNDLRIQRRTLDILGEEMQRAGQDRGQAIRSTVDRIVAETGASPATARDQIRRLTAVHQDSPLLMAEYGAAAPSNAAVRSTRNPENLDLREVARPVDNGAHMVIDDLANGSGNSSGVVRNAVAERNLGMRDVAREQLESFAPRAPGAQRVRTIEDLDQMQEGARRAAEMEYQAAYSGQTNNRLLMGLLPRILDRHINRMNGRAGAPAEALRGAVDEFFLHGQGGQRIAMMDLQHLQDARGALRDRIETARRAGNNQIVATLQPLYRDVTRLMERANPTWARANQRWADNSLDTVARELGEAFSLRAGPQYREQARQFQALAPEAQDMVRVEFLQKIFDRLDNLADTHDVAKLFATDHIRNSIRELFGARAAAQVAQMTRDASIATRSQRMLGNSQTHMRGMRQREADADTGVLAAAQNMNMSGIKSAMLDRLWAFFTERRNRPLAEIATTPMRDTAEVARHIHNMRVAQEFVRRITSQTQAGRLSSPSLAGISASTNDKEAR